MADDLVPLFEAAQQLGIPYPTAWGRWRRGRIPYVRQHGLIWVKLSDVKMEFQQYRPRGQAEPIPVSQDSH